VPQILRPSSPICPSRGSLLGKRVLEGVTDTVGHRSQTAVRPALQTDCRGRSSERFGPSSLRRDSNEIGHHFRVIRSWLAIDFEKHNQTKNDRSQYDGYYEEYESCSGGSIAKVSVS